MCLAGLAQAQTGENDFEASRVEATLSAWIVNARGKVQTGPLPIDLRSDLGIGQRQPTFTGRLDVKPARRHHIIVEGTPYKFSGANTLSRTITFRGTQYSFNEAVASTADVDYVLGGYQFDVLSRKQGHLGVFAGAAYVDAGAVVQAPRLGLTAAESRQIGLPLPGLDFRVYAIPGRRLLNFNGNLQGMSFGGYGRFVKGAVHTAVSPVRFMAIEAGYMVMDADIQSKSGVRGVAPHFSGPVFSVQFRDR